MRIVACFIVLFAGLVIGAAEGLKEAGAQALTIQQRQALQAQKNSPEADQSSQSLEQLLAPTVRRLVNQELASQKAEEEVPQGDGAKAGSDPFADLIDSARNSVQGLSRNFQQTLKIIPELSEHTDRAFILLTDLEGWPRMWEGIFNLAFMLLGGWVVARLLRRLLNRILTVPVEASEHGTERLTVSAILLVRDLVLLAAFVVTGFLLSLVWFTQSDPMRIFLITYLGAYATGLLGVALADFLFAPGRPGHRLVHAEDRTTRKLRLWMELSFATVGLVGFSVGMIRLLGMPPATFDLLLLCAGLALGLVTLWLVSGLTAGTSAGAAGLLSGLFSRYRRTWYFIAVGLFLLLWLASVFSGDGTKVAAVLIGFAAAGLVIYLGNLRTFRTPQFVLAAQRAEAHIPVDPEFAAEMEELGETPVEPSETVLEEPVRTSLLPGFRQVVSVLLGLVVLLSVLHVLGLDMVAAYNSRMGQQVSLVLLDVAVIMLVASLCWTLVERTISRFAQQEHENALAMLTDAVTDEDGLGGVITSRFGTLLPLIRGFVLSVLVAVTIMVVLSSMGIDIGPLLAGAGVVGIAIGFGAQALVRDIISGIFFLIDDAFRVGEYVEFGEIRGQVEQISIRSMRLRHHRGAIHTVPFGELRSITNYNRDWAIYKQEFRLHYEVNTDQVRKIIKKVGLRLLEDPELGPKFIQPLKSQGVFKIEEGALILRTKFMCKPREQFIIRKAVFQEVKNDLYKAGIELAQRRVQIDWPEWMGEEDGEPGEPQPGGAGQPGTSGPPTPTGSQQQAMIGGAAGAAQIATENRTKPVYPDEP